MQDTSNLVRRWDEITPAEAAAQKLDLARDVHITAPLNENGERCPWPWEPQQLVGAPLGQYRCGYCGAMVVAGVPHVDYAPDEREVTPSSVVNILEWCEPSKLRYETVGDRMQCVGLTVVGADGSRTPARFGDTVVRDGFGEFSVRPASPTA